MNNPIKTEVLIQSSNFTLVYKVLSSQSKSFLYTIKSQFDKYCKHSSLTIYKSIYNLKKEFNGQVSEQEVDYEYYYFDLSFSSRQKLKQDDNTLFIISPKYYIYKNNNVNYVYPFLLERQNINNSDFFVSQQDKITKIDNIVNENSSFTNRDHELEEHFHDICALDTVKDFYEYIYDNGLVYYADVIISKLKIIHDFNLKMSDQKFSYNLELEDLTDPIFLKDLFKSPKSTIQDNLSLNTDSSFLNKNKVTDEQITTVLKKDDYSNHELCFYIFSSRSLENDSRIKQITQNILADTDSSKKTNALTFLGSYYKITENPYRMRSPNKMLLRPFTFMSNDLRSKYLKFIYPE